jgi:hypothetical protein
MTYPVEACRPRPRLPPVTTAVFPARENREEKSLMSDIVAKVAAGGKLGKCGGHKYISAS